jgi:hypothetical protein
MVHIGEYRRLELQDTEGKFHGLDLSVRPENSKLLDIGDYSFEIPEVQKLVTELVEFLGDAGGSGKNDRTARPIVSPEPPLFSQEGEK